MKSDGDDASISSSREVDTVDDAQCAQPLDSDHEEEYLSKRHFSRQKSKSVRYPANNYRAVLEIVQRFPILL